MAGLIMLAQLLLAVLIIAGIHEWGHMAAARLFGIRVEQFSVGFPPRLFSWRWRGTEYIFGAIPLGGYVKISGMVDESLDLKQLQKPPEPHEFRSKPVWQRLIVMLGGIIMNLLTGIVILSIMALVQGERYLPAEVVRMNGIQVDSLGEQLGLRTGDRIVSLSGQPYTRFDELIAPEVFLDAGNYYEVERNSKRLRIDIPSDFVENFSTTDRRLFMKTRTPFRVGSVVPGSAAAAAGLVAGDSIIRFAGSDIRYFDELRTLIKTHVGSEPVSLTVLRSRASEPPEQLSLTATLKEPTLGINSEPRLPYAEDRYGFLEGFAVGTKRAFSLVWLNILGITKIVKGEVSAQRSLSGPIGIAQMFGGHWQWARFWFLVALISVFVALFNLLPIPALDGGHVLFCFYEMATGKPLPTKFLHYTQTAGMVLLIALTVFVLFNDILKLF